VEKGNKKPIVCFRTRGCPKVKRKEKRRHKENKSGGKKKRFTVLGIGTSMKQGTPISNRGARQAKRPVSEKPLGGCPEGIRKRAKWSEEGFTAFMPSLNKRVRKRRKGAVAPWAGVCPYRSNVKGRKKFKDRRGEGDIERGVALS